MTEGVPRVAVIFTGGTISMRLDPATGAAVPALGGAEILALTPGLDAIAEIVPIDWGRVPASHLSLDQVLDIALVVGQELGDPAYDGAVVVQGTDTIEETAFALDLILGGEAPIVVVGAMRNADAPDYDGPANLRNAVAAAASWKTRGLGTLVAMHGELLPADDVVKLHTDQLDAFGAPNLGAVGTVRDGSVDVFRGASALRAGRRRIGGTFDRPGEPVMIVPAWVGSDGTLLRAAVRAGALGIVVAATGAGNTHPDMLAAAVEAMATGIPVAIATRVPSGPASGAYGFPGGGATWLAAGAMSTGYLSASKARMAMALGVATGVDHGALRTLLEGGPD